MLSLPEVSQCMRVAVFWLLTLGIHCRMFYYRSSVLLSLVLFNGCGLSIDLLIDWLIDTQRKDHSILNNGTTCDLAFYPESLTTCFKI